MNIIEFKNVTKTFLGGKIVANDNISFTIKQGEIHAIAGENGAGKSTLLSMLFGLYKPDKGKILVRNKAINYRSAANAMRDGLGMVQQHFQLVEKFTVGQNILLGKEKTKWGFLKNQREYQKINQLAKEYSFGINANQKVTDLTVGQEQKTEILKLLYSDSEVFIFDEPTAMLIPEEIEHLLFVIKKLKEKQKTIILITHKLNEIKAVADRVSVLRKGQYVGEILKQDLSAEKLSKMMVGTNLKKAQKKEVSLGKKVLEIKNLKVKTHDIVKLKNISLDVKAGEILAIAGVEGNGQTELANAILGLSKITQGSITFFPRSNKKSEVLAPINLVHLNVSKRNDLIASIPEDRHRYGMVLDMKLYENIFLKTFWKDYTKFGFLNRMQMKKDALAIINNYDVRNANQGMVITRSLSGGNQQKAVIGREISSNRDLMVIFQATRGLDVGAIEYIHSQILNAATQNKAILLISYDIEEIMKLADRIIVFNQGVITGEMTRGQMTRHKLGILMSSQKGEVHV